MSAWVCDAKHIAVVANEIVKRSEGRTAVHEDIIVPAETLAERLGELNLLSVGYLYNLTPAAAAKEFTGRSKKKYLELCREFALTYPLWQDNFSPERVWGLIACYGYQSCEGPCSESAIYKTVVAYEDILEAECKALGITQFEGWSL